MNKQTRIWLIVGVAAVAVYFIYRYIQNRGGTETGTGALGSNLNSVAPELVGGSAGPTQGPAVSVPVNITLTSQDTAPDQSERGSIPANNQTAAGAISSMNAGVNSTERPATPMTSPMRSTGATPSPMTAQHRAAKHPAVTGQAQSNMATSAAGGTKPAVPSPTSHAAHHTKRPASRRKAK